MKLSTPSLPFGPRVLSVSEVVDGLKKTIETEFRDVLVQGEISNFKASSAGHLYFTLKDENAQLSAVCFRRQAAYLKFKPEDGMKVTARGSATVYPPRGNLQFMVESLEPEGLGALQLAFEQLKQRLKDEGLFDEAKKKRLPLLPAKIGVVTSPTGAAIQDILRVLKRRNNRLSVIIFPSRVQGDQAAAEIIKGIEVLDKRDDIDVIIVGRGGGSLEDLWPFNQEEVARAIHSAQKPVISAVGHEVDFTIADFVADLRAPTPSAAAEIVSAGRIELQGRLESLKKRSIQSIRYRLESKRRSFEYLIRSRGFSSLDGRIRIFIQRLDEFTARLQRSIVLSLDRIRDLRGKVEREIIIQTDKLLVSRSRRIEAAKGQLVAFSPQKVLQRGYAIVSTEAGAVVRTPNQVLAGEVISIRVAKGSFKARKE